MQATQPSPTSFAFGDLTIMELSPQIISFVCDDEHLNNKCTSPHYQIGKRDAIGRLIRPDDFAPGKGISHQRAREKMARMVAFDKDRGIETIGKGEEMLCVDWRCKHKPRIWKIYKNTQEGETPVLQVDEDGEIIRDMENQGIPVTENGKIVMQPVMRFIKDKEIADKNEALAYTQKLAEGMI